VLSFGKVSQDHQRIGGIFRRLCGHMIQLTLAYRAQTAATARSWAIAGRFAPGSVSLGQARGGERQRGVDQAPQGVQRMSHLQVIGLGATGWPEDDLAEDLRAVSR
jgi:hypothetical protein